MAEIRRNRAASVVGQLRTSEDSYTFTGEVDDRGYVVNNSSAYTDASECLTSSMANYIGDSEQSDQFFYYSGDRRLSVGDVGELQLPANEAGVRDGVEKSEEMEKEVEEELKGEKGREREWEREGEGVVEGAHEKELSSWVHLKDGKGKGGEERKLKERDEGEGEKEEKPATSDDGHGGRDLLSRDWNEQFQQIVESVNELEECTYWISDKSDTFSEPTASTFIWLLSSRRSITSRMIRSTLSSC